MKTGMNEKILACKELTLTQWSLTCPPQTSSTSTIWEFIRKENSQAPPGTVGLAALGLRQRSVFLTSPPGNSKVLWSLRTSVLAVKSDSNRRC